MFELFANCQDKFRPTMIAPVCSVHAPLAKALLRMLPSRLVEMQEASQAALATPATLLLPPDQIESLVQRTINELSAGEVASVDVPLMEAGIDSLAATELSSTGPNAPSPGAEEAAASAASRRSMIVAGRLERHGVSQGYMYLWYMLPPGRHTSYSLAGYGAVGCPRAVRGCDGCAHAADLGEACKLSSIAWCQEVSFTVPRPLLIRLAFAALPSKLGRVGM